MNDVVLKEPEVVPIFIYQARLFKCGRINDLLRCLATGPSDQLYWRVEGRTYTITGKDARVVVKRLVVAYPPEQPMVEV